MEKAWHIIQTNEDKSKDAVNYESLHFNRVKSAPITTLETSGTHK